MEPCQSHRKLSPLPVHVLVHLLTGMSTADMSSLDPELNALWAYAHASVMGNVLRQQRPSAHTLTATSSLY